jgi:hypothetical protein
MSQGLQVFRSDGTVSVDVTNRIPKFVGSATIDGNAQSGTISDNNLRDGDIWFMLLAVNYPDPNLIENSGKTWETPTITKGDRCLNWSFPNNRKVSCVILYGVF